MVGCGVYSYDFLLLPIASSVSCSCVDALNTISSKLPPPPTSTVSRLVQPLGTIRLTLLLNTAIHRAQPPLPPIPAILAAMAAAPLRPPLRIEMVANPEIAEERRAHARALKEAMASGSAVRDRRPRM